MTNEPLAEEPVVLPASFVQELLWLMDRASPGSSAYNVPRTRRLVGALNADALRRAFDALVARHEILRTTYAFHEERPVQVIRAARPVDYTFADLRDRPDPVVEAERLAREQARKPFDLSRDQLMRVNVFRTGEREHVLHFDSHHIAFDGWSRDVLVRELAAFYAEFTGGAPASLPELPIQYADYALWERDHLSGDNLARLLQYWRDRLGGAQFVLELPTDFPRPAVPGFGGVTESITFTPPQLAGIRALARAHDATVYLVLLAAYATVLHRYTAQPDVLVGSPVAGRSRPETEGLIGYFANTIVHRAGFTDDPAFGALLDRLRDGALSSYEHQDVPFEKLVLELQGGQQLSHAPIFQAMFTQLGGGGDGSAARFGDVEVQPFGTDDTVTKFDLTLFMLDRNDALTLTLRARSDLYAKASVRRALGHIARVLDAAVARPLVRVSEIDLLSDSDRSAIATANATIFDLGAPATITGLFESCAPRLAARVAVRCGDNTATYAELDARANRIAHRLQKLGVTAGDAVGVMLDRSTDLIASILGVMKAGAAYVPVLPDVPAARLAQQFAECKARACVTMASFADRVPAGCIALALDGDAGALAAEADTAPTVAVTPDATAYVLFTSGSTGVPKGVAVTHANAVNYTRAISRVFASVPAPRSPISGLPSAVDAWHFGMASTIAADLGNTSLFPSLCGGGTLHLLPADVTTDPARFAAYTADHPLDALKITPNHLRALLGSAAGAELVSALPRRWIVLGGEALSWEFAERLLRAGKCRVLNHYGPTETTVGASTFEVTAASAAFERASGAQTVPIGRPLANLRMHVLDARRNAQPIGIPGELYVAGAGVARGYVNRDDLTAERFVTLPSVGRAYRTGDRVRRLESGAMEFLGRNDDQVKIRGFRVELAEIEQTLAAHPAVAASAARAFARTAADDAQIAAYVALREQSDYAKAHTERPTAAGFQEWVASKLPSYMVPASVTILDRIPLSANGKVDRAALPDPTAANTSAEAAYVAPRTATEEALATIWTEVLKKERVGVTDHFIELGGHSLLAIRVLGKLSRRFGVRLPLRTLFDAPTVEQLAELVDLEVQIAAVNAVSSGEAPRA